MLRTVVLWIVAAGAVFGQTAAMPDGWLGVWAMVPGRSTFDANAPLKAAGQTLEISANGAALHIAGDTVMPDGRHIVEASDLNLNGTPQTIAGGAVSFKRLDDWSFDIVVRLKAAAGEGVGTNRFSFSQDGKVLTETKTQTLGGTATTSVLVFERQ